MELPFTLGVPDFVAAAQEFRRARRWRNAIRRGVGLIIAVVGFEVVFNAHGISFRAALVNNVNGWDSFRGYAEDLTTLILRRREGPIVVVPKRDISSEALSSLQSVLRQNLPSRL